MAFSLWRFVRFFWRASRLRTGNTSSYPAIAGNGRERAGETREYYRPINKQLGAAPSRPGVRVAFPNGSGRDEAGWAPTGNGQSMIGSDQNRSSRLLF
jgi:hypothetical protein